MTTAATAILIIALLAPVAAAQGDAAAPAPAEENTPAPAAVAPPPEPAAPFDSAAARVRADLDAAIAELAALRDRIAVEKIPLHAALNQLERDLSAVRLEYQESMRRLDKRALDLAQVQRDIERFEKDETYLDGLLGEFLRNFETRLHIAEQQRYERVVESAKLAPENTNLAPDEVYEARIDLVEAGLERLHEALGGTTFDGTAVADGLVHSGTYALLGPAAIFRSSDGRHVGTAEQRLGSVQPAAVPFANPLDAAVAAQVIGTGVGLFPLDPTLGNAIKVESTEETLVEHVRKGGPVMVPIFALAAAALLIALYKWVALMLVRKPSKKKISALLNAVADHDQRLAKRQARGIRGPVGEMLVAGVDHIDEPRELIEEVMYETVLTTRLEVNRMLPFIAISAASAPLLGLLGTVTGIINTFKLITVFGSGDVKTLSGGISEALITTEFGLIVAIPSLLLHAFLTRKARSVIGLMETTAVSFMNQVTKSGYGRDNGAVRRSEVPPRLESAETDAGAGSDAGTAGGSPESAPAGRPSAEQVRESLVEVLTPMIQASLDSKHDAPVRQKT